uniref:Bm1468 n=1 Tax=Brugia malayi TaxID=6279 RepID=A0A0J9Y039_BRUMA|nr:Bm1468 [Brugia malayi]
MLPSLHMLLHFTSMAILNTFTYFLRHLRCTAITTFASPVVSLKLSIKVNYVTILMTYETDQLHFQ